MERKCTICEEEFVEGYIINDGEEYYYSLECLSAEYSDIAYGELYEQGIACWTSHEEYEKEEV